MKTLTVLALLMLFLTQPAHAVTPTTYVTTPPADGTTAVLFEWAVSMDGGEFVEVPELTTEPEITLDLQSNVRYMVRVRALDDEDHAGGWSPASIEYVFGAPGLCTRPTIKTNP